MWKIGIMVVMLVYVLVYVSMIIAVKVTNNMLRNENLSIPIERTKYVLKIVLGIYFLPLVMLVVCMICCVQLVGFIIVASMLMALPITRYIVIPLSNRKYAKMKEKSKKQSES